MTLLQVQYGTKQIGRKTLFSDATFSINDGEHVGVIGPNGAGKTTLFRILVDMDHLDSGVVTKAKGLRIGYLEQEPDWHHSQTAEEHLTAHSLKPIWELKRLGQRLGLTEEHFTKSLPMLSGGYRMRMKLLGLIGQEPDLMLLDEPTNFLDLESVIVLEDFLQAYKGAFLLISHDREFLRRTTESTLEVEAGEITKFPGHIDDYFEQKAQLRLILAAQVANQEAKRRQVLDFVSRFGAKATKARQAQSRLRRLDKMEKIEVADLPVRAKIRIPAPTPTGKEVLILKNADLGYGPERVILSHVNLRLERGAHVGVVGHNGAGKSTLLKTLASQLPPLRGDLQFGYQVSLSYYSQHVTDQLNLNDTILGVFQAAAKRDVGPQEILSLAGSLLFSGDDVHKPIQVLSGGEKSRVALGQILLKRSPLLLLDEPTNHLDFETVEALTEALRAYEGTVVVVSHDRGFIGRIANRILEIDQGRVDYYPGTYDEYLWSLQKGVLSGRDRNLADSYGTDQRDHGKPAAPKLNFKEENRRLQGLIKERKREIRKCEELIGHLTNKRDQLTNELLGASGVLAANLGHELGLCAREIDQHENEMLSHMEQLESLEKEIKT
jgi:ATP-binding cassette subfamily F protein 3